MRARCFSVKIIFASLFFFSSFLHAADLKEGMSAPTFVAKTQDGKEFDLKSRQKTWTVLYFYPKSGTPGCTKEACAFRDNVKKIEAQGAGVFGISINTVEGQAKFHKEHHLNFPLLADPKGKVVSLYGTKMSDRDMSKRWTFVIGPDLKIRKIEKDVDPVLDAQRVANELAVLKKKG